MPPLCQVVRVSECSRGAAPITSVASASISSCRMRSHTTLSVFADGGVVQSCVVGRHLRGVVVEDAAYDLLRDVAVDHAGAQGVAALVRGEVGGTSVFVAGLAELQSAVGGQTVSRTHLWVAAVGVLRRPREQVWAALWPAGENTLLLLVAESVDFLVDGDEGLAFHLVVDVTGVGGAVGVLRSGVEGEFQCVAHQAEWAPRRSVIPETTAGALPGTNLRPGPRSTDSAVQPSRAPAARRRPTARPVPMFWVPRRGHPACGAQRPRHQRKR